MAGVAFWRHLLSITILPFNVTVVVPSAILILGESGPDFALVRSLAGAALVAFGLSLMVRTISLFDRVGEGTLAPWDETRHLVVQGVYRHVRNPMISGVLSILLGEAIAFGSPALLLWFAIFFAGNAVYMPLSEEPGLEKRFGEAYREYKRNVPRWIPRRTPWRPPE